MCSITAERLYRAFADRDLDGLRAVLAEGFVGEVSAGMPLGVGGRHDGPEAMLRDVWLPVFGVYDVTPVPVAMTAAADGTVVVRGWYRGSVRATGQAMEAEFVHVLGVEGDRVTSLRQVTDTACWPRPVAAGPG